MGGGGGGGGGGRHITSLIFLVFVREIKRELKSFFRRSMKFHRSKFVEPRTKVHHLDDGYA